MRSRRAREADRRHGGNPPVGTPRGGGTRRRALGERRRPRARVLRRHVPVMTTVVVLDSLFASLDVEEQAAREAGATLTRWDGDPASLAEADVVAHVRTRVD